MNKQDNFSIKIRKRIFSRSVYDANLKSLQFSETSCGMYCASKLRYHNKGVVLCILLDKYGNYISENILNRDFSVTLDKLCSAVKSLADEYDSNDVLLATDPDDGEDFPYTSAKATVIGDRLKELHVNLYGYYITNGIDYEDITPSAD